MLGAADLPLYLVAVKSLLRFYNSVAVVVHSDGTLEARHERLLTEQVPGCTLIAAGTADERARHELGPDSFLYRCRSLDVNYRRLIDTEIWNTSRKRIIMDADVLTLRRPEELVRWIESDEKAFLMGDVSTKPPPQTLAPTAHVQTVFKYRLKELGESLGWPCVFLDGTTAGFYGCSDALALERIEKVIKKCVDLHLPLGHWGSDQCVVIYLLSVTGPTLLDPERYFNFWPSSLTRLPGAHVVHFLGTNRFYKNCYAELAAGVVGDLGNRAVLGCA
jgi:hypothetical protein